MVMATLSTLMRLVALKFFWSKLSGIPIMPATFLDCINGRIWVLHPPSFRFVHVGFHCVALGLRQGKLIELGGEGTISKAGARIGIEPGVALTRDSEQACWIKRWRAWWSARTL